jgi:hypothetical protein
MKKNGMYIWEKTGYAGNILYEDDSPTGILTENGIYDGGIGYGAWPFQGRFN